MSRRYWYQFNGADGEENLIGKYTVASSSFPPGSCSLGGAVCQIYAAGATNPYAISSTLLNYITNAKSTGTYRPNTLNQKPYVYTRSTVL